MDYLFPDNLDSNYANNAIQISDMEEQDQRSSPSEGSHICQICGKEFASKRNVARHIKVLHEPHSKQRVRTPRIHICRFCGAGFAQIRNMNTHVETIHESNTTNRKHICRFCGGGFPGKGYLTRHIREIHESNGRCGGKGL